MTIFLCQWLASGRLARPAWRCTASATQLRTQRSYHVSLSSLTPSDMMRHCDTHAVLCCRVIRACLGADALTWAAPRAMASFCPGSSAYYYSICFIPSHLPGVHWQARTLCSARAPEKPRLELLPFLPSSSKRASSCAIRVVCGPAKPPTQCSCVRLFL